MSQVNYNLFLNIYIHAAIVASILNDEKNIHQLKYSYNVDTIIMIIPPFSLALPLLLLVRNLFVPTNERKSNLNFTLKTNKKCTD